MKLLFFALIFNFACLSKISCGQSKSEERTEKLIDITSKTPVIRLNNERFKFFVKDTPRSYSMILMFTALSPERQCAMCKNAHDEYQKLVRSYRYSESFTEQLFFGMVDFDDAPEVFQALQLNSAPLFIHFPANGKQRKGDQMDRNRGFSAEDLAKWVEERTEIQIKIVRQPNYYAFFITGLCGIIVVITLYSTRKNLGFLFSRVLWSILILGVVCFFISGQTWNSINNPPFASENHNRMEYFAGDANMQYVAETYVVFLLYFGVGLGIILLNEAPKLKIRTAYLSTIVAIAGILMVIFLFSYILSVFRAKYEGYPYSFLIH